MASKKPTPASSINRALNEIGDQWTCLVLLTAFGGIHSFDQWRKRLGISPGILSNRLKKLVDNGSLYKKYRSVDGKKTGHAKYYLSQKGMELYPWVLAAWRWERQCVTTQKTAVKALRHTLCGQRMMPEFNCNYCRQKVLPCDIKYVDGPGKDFDEPQNSNFSRRSLSTLTNADSANDWAGYFSALLSDRWTCLVIVATMPEQRRFDFYLQELNIATNILSDRLKRLMELGILKATPYQTQPVRYDYALTEKGLDMFPIFLTLQQWGDRWLSRPEGVPQLLYHIPCGQRLQTQATCDHCHGVIDPHDVEINPD